MAKQDKQEWELPHFREVHQMESMMGTRKNNPALDFWSVKFYPYTKPGVDPVFAVVGGTRIMVCRPPQSENGKMEVIQLIIDEDHDANHYTCAWSKDLSTGTPLLCVSGQNAKIKVIDVISGKCRQVLSGHGGDINDLAVSPINPHILASASVDQTIRIWSLDPEHTSQPLAAILDGEGHKGDILTLAWHATGRFIVSGGMDSMINLWTVPVFPDDNTGTKHPTRIFYPHFSSLEIHYQANVDCVAFHADTLLSKCDKSHTISLTTITSFLSSSPPPPTSAPSTHDTSLLTRSAFVPASSHSTPLFTRHLQLSLPDTDSYFMRFALSPIYKTPTNLNPHPVVAFCNCKGKVMFWDLDRFIEYYDVLPSFPGGPTPPTPPASPPPPQLSTETQNSKGKEPEHTPTQPSPSKPNTRAGGSVVAGNTKRETPAQTPRSHPFLTPFQHRLHSTKSSTSFRRPTSPSLSTTTSSSHPQSSTSNHPSHPDDSSAGKIDWQKSRQRWEKKYSMGDPRNMIEAHGVEVVKGVGEFTGRQVAWSTGGEWCVVVGSSGVIALFGRGGK